MHKDAWLDKIKVWGSLVRRVNNLSQNFWMNLEYSPFHFIPNDNKNNNDNNIIVKCGVITVLVWSTAHSQSSPAGTPPPAGSSRTGRTSRGSSGWPLSGPVREEKIIKGVRTLKIFHLLSIETWPYDEMGGQSRLVGGETPDSQVVDLLDPLHSEEGGLHHVVAHTTGGGLHQHL